MLPNILNAWSTHMYRFSGFERPLLWASRKTRIENRFPMIRLIVMITTNTLIVVEVDTHLFLKACTFIRTGGLEPVGLRNDIFVALPASCILTFGF